MEEEMYELWEELTQKNQGKINSLIINFVNWGKGRLRVFAGEPLCMKIVWINRNRDLK